MHFCKKCDNMYYIKLNDDEKQLIHYCRHCGFEDTELSTKKLSISKKRSIIDCFPLACVF